MTRLCLLSCLSCLVLLPSCDERTLGGGGGGGGNDGTEEDEEKNTFPTRADAMGCNDDVQEDPPDQGGTAGSGSDGGLTGGEDGGGDEGGDGSASGDGDGDGDSGTTGDPGDGDGDEGGIDPGEIPPGQLTAGEWRDLDHWPFWEDLMAGPHGQQQAHWDFYPDQRFSVLVHDGEAPAADTRVVLRDIDDATVWEARTDNRGRADLFAGLFGDAPDGPFSLVLESGNTSRVVDEVEATGAGDPLVLDLRATAPFPGLDLMFVVDTTGSMGDEIAYLQAELADVVRRVEDEAAGELDVRLSMNFYKDEGDVYVVRPYCFTRDVERAVDQIDNEFASGGGDFPEALEQALYNGVYGHAWREDARARLLFLVLDAPPHHTQENIARLQDVVAGATERGIRIVPVSASGIDQETEFLLRFLDISTASTYTFLTDHSGIGNPHLEPTIPPVQIEFLNDLLVRLITESVE